MNADNINEELMKAVEMHDLDSVIICLKKGADPNYKRSWVDDLPNGLMQPSTPLRMVMFCISDNLLDDNGLILFAEIAKVLLKHGADPKPAMEIAEFRYGKYDPDTPPNAFMDIWNIIANAK